MAKNNMVYVVSDVEGTFTKLADVAKALGVKRVTRADIEEEGKYADIVSALTEEEAKALTTEDVDDEPITEEQVAEGEATEEPTEEVEEEATEDSTEEDSEEVEEEASVGGDGDSLRDFPERGEFDSPEELKDYYKELDDSELDDWMELEGISYTPNEHAGINRMRKCMAIRDYHFPKAPSKKKSQRKYEQSTEELVEMALDNDVEVPDDKGDPRILRMYTIIALRKAGILE